MFSVLIGIADDVHLVEDLLVQRYGLLRDRTIKLLDDKANRHNILQVLRGFLGNSHIGSKDPIFIYFAGHGSEVLSPNGQSFSDKVHILLPQDFKLERKKTEIFHEELAECLAEIATARSNNLTVVIDRSFGGNHTIDKRVAGDMFASRGGNVSLERKLTRLDSLSALQDDDQLASQTKSHGRFT
ncbi:hypothetical protein H0H93_006028, partial [Arthromyces matolae]